MKCGVGDMEKKHKMQDIWKKIKIILCLYHKQVTTIKKRRSCCSLRYARFEYCRASGVRQGFDFISQ